MKFRKGQAVMYRAEGGSVGRILGSNSYGGYYVEWHYGRDAKGEPWTAKSSVEYELLVAVPRRLATEHAKCRAFSPEQMKVYNQIKASVSLNVKV